MHHQVAFELREKFGYGDYLSEELAADLGDDALNLASEEMRPLSKTIRVNTLKIEGADLEKRLRSKGFELRKLEWVNNCYEVLKEPPKPSLGATEEYVCGYYYIQSAVSAYIVQSLDVKPGETVLDLAAGPGGKTTYVAQLMSNKGVLVAVEPRRERVAALRSNISRMGCENTLIVQTDGRNVSQFGFGFDKVLLDAPCTGSGLISVHPALKTRITAQDVVQQSSLQLELAEAALSALKPGGTLVYSVCSLLRNEGEKVACALQSRGAQIEQLNHPEGLRASPARIKLKGTLRFYRDIQGTEGFFVCKMTAPM